MRNCLIQQSAFFPPSLSYSSNITPFVNLKGVKKTFTATKMAITFTFLHYIHDTPITGSGILSDFQIIL